MTGPSGGYAFLPYLQRGASTLIEWERRSGTVDPIAAPRATLKARLTFGDPAHTAVEALELYGPGEVTGFDARAVIRTAPRAHVGDAMPNDFALIEFDQADLPWRYTPDTIVPNVIRAPRPAVPSRDRLSPWLILIVLKAEEIFRYDSAGGLNPLPVVMAMTEVLPDITQSWAWAHVQVSGVKTLTFPDALRRFESAPETMTSRLISTRILEPRTAYRAFVVPAYERGRLRGLGRDPEKVSALAPIAPEKAPGINAFLWVLPVYYEWDFQTAAAASDFESLVRRMTARPLPATVGTRAVEAAAPDPALPPVTLEPLRIDGALASPAAAAFAWDPAERVPFVNALTDLLNRPKALLRGSVAPAFAPPLYGRWLAAVDGIDVGGPAWLDTLNRDPRARIAAGAGAQVVASEEQKLLVAAWQQVDGLSEINEALRFAQLARALAGGPYARLKSLAPETLLSFAAPLLTRLTVGGRTIARVVAESTIGRGALEATFRRLTRRRGPFGQRRARITSNAPFALLQLLNSGTIVPARPPTPPPGLVLAFPRTGAASVAGAAPNAGFTILPEAGPGLRLPPFASPAAAPLDSADAAVFRKALVEALRMLEAPRRVVPPRHPLSFDDLSKSIVGASDPAATIADRFGKRLQFGFARAARDPIEPILTAPEFEQPMFEPLRALSEEWILPGLAAIPTNTISLAVVNQRFIEAYMAGLTHEMTRSLLWHDYPTDQRGTIFRQFWEVRGYFGPHTRDELRDIVPIDRWPAAAALGANSSRPPLLGGAQPIVLLLRGDLLQQVPTAVLYAARASRAGAVREPMVPPEEVQPVFRGTIGGDIAFFGFELTADQARGSDGGEGWFFILQEQPSEPRFGPPAGSTGPFLEPAAATAADFAAATYRPPVRVAVHAADVMP